MNVQVSRIAIISVALAITAIIASIMGAFGAHFEIVPVFVGFMIFLSGLLLGVLAFFLGGIGLLRTRPGSARAGRNLATLGFVLGGGLTVLSVGLASPGDKTPVINDISTNREDPPLFENAARVPENRGQDLRYPTAFSPLQLTSYPEIAPIEVDLTADAAFERALAVAHDLGWTITTQDERTRTFEATDRSAFFHFVDDIAVRVRPIRSGAVVDIRSRSRMGKGDLGTNAKRIRSFSKRMSTKPAPGKDAPSQSNSN